MLNLCIVAQLSWFSMLEKTVFNKLNICAQNTFVGWILTGEMK